MTKINLASAPVAAGKMSKKNLHKTTLTTIGFYQMCPTLYWHTIARERIKGVHRLLSRANPLVLPAMIDSEFHVNDFYVRWRDVWPAYNDYDQKTIYHFSDGQSKVPERKPYVTRGFLANLFLDTTNLLMIAGTSTDYDVNGSLNNAQVYRKFTSRGRAVYKVLCNLGYKLAWNDNDKEPINVMALLAYMKIYFDWYFPPQYLNAMPAYNTCVRAFNNTTSDLNSPYSSAVAAFFTVGLGTFVWFDDDSMSVVWERPNAPADVNAEVYNFNITQGLGDNIVADTTSDYEPFLDLSTNHKFSKIGLDFMVKLSNYIKRHQLAGARFVDRFLLSRGVALQDSHRAIRLGESRIPVKVGDVEANASSSNGSEMSVLGELAGKSISWNQKPMSFNYNAQSFDGIFMSITSLVANSRYGTGMDRHNIHIYRTDDYDPTFDALGCSAVRKDEVYCTNDYTYNANGNGIFGFLPRYYEYALSKDILSGNFIIPTAGADELSGYHLFRDYKTGTPFTGALANLQMNMSFLYPSWAAMSTLNRLFYSAGELDNFILKFDSQFESYSTKKQLSHNYDFTGEEGHEVVSVESQGVHVQ